MRLINRGALALLLAAAVILLPGCPRQGSMPVEDTTTAEPAEGEGGSEPQWAQPDADAEKTEQLGAEGFGEPAIAQQDLEPGVQSVEQELSEGRRVLQTVYFALDSFNLSDVALRTIEANAAWLRQHPALRAVVEGHCDERGTLEYNMDLGAKRARAVRDHLTRLGVDAGQLEVISYGEERPVDTGHSEQAWARNRRAELVLEKQ